MLAYIPVFGLFLPVSVSTVSANPLVDQSIILLIGGITASLAGVLAGRLSDWVFQKLASRRPMIWAGLMTIGASYALFANAAAVAGLVAAIIVLQIGINLVLGGLNALFAVHVAIGQKAHLASMVNLCLPIANIGLMVLGGAAAHEMGMRLAVLGLFTLGLSAPILLWRLGQQEADSTPNVGQPHPIYGMSPALPTWITVFAARFFVQLSAALLLAFVHPYLVSKVNGISEAERLLNIMVVLAAIVSLPLAIIAARLATRRFNPLAVLQCAAAILALAMGSLALTPTHGVIIVSYAMFMAALVTYLAIDTAIISQWLAHSPEVATRLGIMNLSNTLPGLIIPSYLLMTGGTVAKGLSGALFITAVGALLSLVLLARAKAKLNSGGVAGI